MSPGAAVGASLDEAERLLQAHGVPEARANVEFLMAHVLGVSRGGLPYKAGVPIDPRAGQLFWRLVRRRAKRIPLAYVLGTQPFMDLELEVSSDVLVPRPETEEVVEVAVKLAEAMRPGLGHGVRALDIGTGSGSIALALAHRLPDAFVVAVDTSRAALRLAAKNAEKLGLSGRVRVLESDLFKPMSGVSASWADLVVSNPPYIPSARIKDLSPEVLNEPRLALDGGKDGLDAIRAIIRQAPSVLRPGGWLVLEMDEGQGAQVGSLLERAGFSDIAIKKDFGGFERVACGCFVGK